LVSLQIRTETFTEFDIFLPSLSLAFEYQGEQHYHWVPSLGSSPSLYQQRDERKRKLCVLYGITLIVVPYWWSMTVESLIATIIQQRPDLISNADHRPSISESYAISSVEPVSLLKPTETGHMFVAAATRWSLLQMSV